jgi:tripeptide aminopeptidase
MVNRERLIETFLALVRIDSPSGEEEALAEALTGRLESLGASVVRDAFGNLIARLDGAGEPLFFGSHLDTVEPGRGVKPVIDGDLIRTDGSTVLGGDAKAGIAAILEGLTAAREQGLAHPPLEIVLTRHEESGLGGAVNLDYTLIKARRGVEFDGEGPVTNVTIAAPARVSVEARFTGRGAHAGVEPERGISAVQMAARFVAGYPQGRLDPETTSNIGLITGGTAVNAVPEHASVQGEFRSRDPGRLADLRRQVETLAATVESEFPGGRVALSLKDEFGGYRMDPSSPTVQMVTDALARIGLRPDFIASGGATDANIFALHGMEVAVVGLGGQDFHTVRETVSIQRLTEAARFCLALISGP